MWTTEQKLDALMRLPWTIVPETDSADGSLVAQVREVPDAIATGQSKRELARELWESLRASLEIRLLHGDEIPMPAGRTVLPWMDETFGKPQVTNVDVSQPVGDLIVRPFAFA